MDKHDEIMVDELKIFVGTELKCFFSQREKIMESVWKGGRGDRFGVTLGGAIVGVWDIKPIVIPMSKITDSDAQWIEFIVDSGGGTFKIEIQKIRDTQLNYEEMCVLANHHYDLFGWLNKKDADRMPLAIEKES
jgi:hypothetical protein